MKRNIIALVGATVILFVWQMLSWMVSPIHKDFSKYTPQEDAVMAALNSTLTEDGMYMMPGMDPAKEATKEEKNKQYTESVGKPYALIMYHKSFPGMRPMNMVFSFLFNMVAVLVAITVVNTAVKSGASAGKRFLLVLSLSVFSMCQGVMLNWNWWEFPGHFIQGEIIDAIVGWSLCGVFLSWYLGKAQKV